MMKGVEAVNWKANMKGAGSFLFLKRDGAG